MSQANVNSIQIEYETFGDKNSPALLLIAGLGAQLLYWQEEFCIKLAEQGYFVIRFDNRDTGLSTKIEGLTAPELMEKIGGFFMGKNLLSLTDSMRWLMMELDYSMRWI